MDWGDYHSTDPWPEPSFRIANRSTALAALDQRLAARHDRISQLLDLARRNGADPDAYDATQRLNDWFRLSATPAIDRPDHLDARWASVADDIVLWIADAAIEWTNGVLGWDIVDTGREERWYRPAITGFAVANPDYHIDLDRLLFAYGSQLARRRPVDPEYFVRLLFTMGEKA